MKQQQVKMGDYNYLIYLYSKVFCKNKILTASVVAFFSLVIPIIYCGITHRLVPEGNISIGFLDDYVACGFFGVLFPVFVYFVLFYTENTPKLLDKLFDENIINTKRAKLHRQIVALNSVMNSNWTILFWIPSLIIQLLWIPPIKNQRVITWLFYSSHSGSGAWAFQNVYFILIAILFTQIMLYFALYLLLITFFLWQLSRNQVKVNPLHPDNCGGLSKIGRVAFLNAIALIILGVGIALVFVSDHAQGHRLFSLPLHYVYSIAYVAGTLVVFFLPLYFFRKPMKDEKEKSLSYLRNLFDTKYSQLPELIIETERQKDIKIINELAGIKGWYDLAKNMPVWPFNTDTVQKFLALFLIPFVVAYLPILIDKLTAR